MDEYGTSMCHTSKAYQVLVEPQALGVWANAVPMELMLSACRYYQTKLLGRRGKRKKNCDARCFLATTGLCPIFFPFLSLGVFRSHSIFHGYLTVSPHCARLLMQMRHRYPVSSSSSANPLPPLPFVSQPVPT